MASEAENTEDLIARISAHPRADALMNSFEETCHAARGILFRGLSMAREHGFDPKSVQENVQGEERDIAIYACDDSLRGEVVMFHAIRSVIEANVRREDEDEGTLV
tara:strand:- start:2021 stop:2338 length:318 start_codon:yes stop_codon:yes gene_type:complete